MCSSTWATPEVPSTSSIEPTRTQSIWTAVGRPAVGLDDQGHAVGERELAGPGPARSGAAVLVDGRRGGLGQRRQARQCQQHRSQHRDRRSAAWQGVFHRMGPIVKSAQCSVSSRKNLRSRVRRRPRSLRPRRPKRPRPPPSRSFRPPAGSAASAPQPAVEPPALGAGAALAGGPRTAAARRRRPAAACSPNPSAAAGSTSSRTACARPAPASQAAFVNAQIDDALYEELEAALLMADTGVKATEFLLEDLRRRVKSQHGAPTRRRSRCCWPTPSPTCCGRWKSRW